MKKLAKYCRLEGKKPSSLIACQLTQMYDRLPPLSLVHRGKWQLDAWHKRVLTYIDEGRSVVVSAPTSSGKTVLSTYLATKTDVCRSKWSKTGSGKWRSEMPMDATGSPKKIQQGILFVTPTEPGCKSRPCSPSSILALLPCSRVWARCLRVFPLTASRRRRSTLSITPQR